MDTFTRSRKQTLHPVTLYLAAAMHMIQGTGVLLDPSSRYALSVWALAQYGPSDYTWLAASVLIIVGILGAAAGIRWLNLWAALPQQVILILATFEAGLSVALGHYPDGTVVPRMHLFVDQVWVGLLMAAHGVAIYLWSDV